MKLLMRSHCAPTWGPQGEAGGLGELAPFRVAEGVDGSGAEAVVPSGIRLQGDLDWLPMGGLWKLGLFGERSRADLLWEPALPSQDGAGLAAVVLQLLFLQPSSRVQEALPSTVWLFFC